MAYFRTHGPASVRTLRDDDTGKAEEERTPVFRDILQEPARQ